MNWKPRANRWVTLSALLILITLTACGEASPTAGNVSAGSVPTATPIPTFTPAPTAKPQQGLMTSQAISGTVTEYDPANKTLTLKDKADKVTKFSLSQAAISKNETLSAAEFIQALNAATIVQVSGENGADGVFSAQSLTLLLDMEGNGQPVFKGPGGSTGPASGSPSDMTIPAGGASSTASANITPGAGTPSDQVVGINSTPGPLTPSEKPGVFIIGGSGANSPLIKNARLENNLLTGDSLSGGPFKANLSPATLFSRRVKGDLPDLKAGQSVTVDVLPNQSDTPQQALRVSIN